MTNTERGIKKNDDDKKNKKKQVQCRKHFFRKKCSRKKNTYKPKTNLESSIKITECIRRNASTRSNLFLHQVSGYSSCAAHSDY